jgi:hypothetical protein
MSDFKVWYEDVGEGRANVHVVVNRWTHNVAKELFKAIDQLVIDMVTDGFTRAYGVGAVHPHFCDYLGGDYLGSVKHNGIDHEVFEWELLPQS